MFNRLAAALAFVGVLLFCAPLPADPIYQSQTYACSKAVTNAGAAGTTRIIVASATQQIYVCGFTFGATAAATVQLEYGTGGTCGTGTTAITPVYSLAALGALVDHPAYYSGLPIAPAGNDVCFVVGGAGPMPMIVYYTQF
jgi:hypothetical protein